ncbi:MAG: hypothetical protein U0996_07500 [Planctomycetaceae bacterium]
MNIGKWKLSLRVAVLGAAVGMSSTAIGQVADVAETLPAAPPGFVESQAPVAASAPSPLDEPARVDTVAPAELPAVSTTIAPTQPARAAFPALPPLDEFPAARATATQPVPATGQRYVRSQDVPANLALRTMGAHRAVPRILQVGEISGDERKALQEDLQVLESLINKAIVGKNHSPDVNMALGVTLYRSEQASYLTWIQDSGLLYQRSLSGVSLAPRSATGSKKDGAKTDEPESEWDAARRELTQFEEAEFVDLTGLGFAGNQRLPAYDEETVESLKKRVAGALKNVGRVRFPQSSAGIAQVCTIALTCPEDGSTITFRIRVTPGGVAAEVGEVSSWQYIDESQASNEPLTALGTEYRPYRYVAPAAPPQPTQPVPTDDYNAQPRRSSARTLSPSPDSGPPDQVLPLRQPREN